MKKTYNIKYYQCSVCNRFTDKRFFCKDCDSVVNEFELIITDNWTTNIRIGNVVLWENELYVVFSIDKTMVSLIPFKNPNMTCHPSINWPFNPKNRIQSIKLVAETIQQYIIDSLLLSFKR